MAAAIEARSMRLSEVAATAAPDWRDPTPKQGHVVQLFFNVNLGRSHRGLRMIATEYEIDLDRIVPGQYVGFLNRRRTAIKLFTSGNVYAYLRLYEGIVTADIINQIPRVFQSTASILLSNPIREAIESEIPLSASEIEQETYFKNRKGRTPMRLPGDRA